MKSFITRQSKKVAIVALAVGLMTTSCNKDKDAPALPAATSMDFSSSSLTGSNKTEGIAYGYVTAGMYYWNSVIALNIAVPVASFKEAFNHEAKYSSKDKDYVWSYDVVVKGTKYTANLHGKVDGDEVAWKMLVSQQGGFQNYEWYTGTSKLDGTSGQWKLNKGATSGTVNYLIIDWTNNSTNSTHSTKFTVSDANDTAYGNYINYYVNTDAEFNGHYDIYDAAKKELTQVMWSTADRHGKVIGPLGNSACWDSATNDVSCN
ncbi:MAG: hypothetical protein ACO3EE_11040 [Flavobacteriales bacterium]